MRAPPEVDSSYPVNSINEPRVRRNRKLEPQARIKKASPLNKTLAKIVAEQEVINGA